MKVFTTDRFPLPLTANHSFPAAKYRLLRERVEAWGMLGPGDLREPRGAEVAELSRVHTPKYVGKMVSGQLSVDEVRDLGFPWSVELVERSKRSVGATIEAVRWALEEGVAVNLAGGTHHAFADRGAGYCVFNDAAVAARGAQAEGKVRRVVVLDCDVHQGDGTAAIFEDDPTVFTFSIHGAKNYPARKRTSDLDVELEDGSGDEAYLEALRAGVTAALAQSGAELAIYLAGADPYEGDRLGRLKVTAGGLLERDRFVFEACRLARVPVAVAMAGGYARAIEETVAIQLRTVEEAWLAWREWRS